MIPSSLAARALLPTRREATRGRPTQPSFTADYVYEKLSPQILAKLREQNPAQNGRRRHRHHQYLTLGTGIPALDQQIAKVTTLMQVSTTPAEFRRLLARQEAAEEDRKNPSLLS